MSLSARLSRIEASAGRNLQRFELVAVDEADAERLFEDTLLRCHPGPCSIRIASPSGHKEWSGQMLAHEDILELLS